MTFCSRQHPGVCCVNCLAAALAMVTPQTKAECLDNCPDCWEYRDKSPVVATMSPPEGPVLCVGSNPPDVTTAEQWATYLGITVAFLDLDQTRWHHSYADFASQTPDCLLGCLGTQDTPPLSFPPLGCDCRCICYDEYDDWTDLQDSNFTVTWSGFVNLEQPGTYILSATLTNDTPPSDTCEPPWPPPTGWFKDDPVTVNCTIIVRDCCGCGECPGPVGDWEDMPDCAECVPGDNWEQDPIVDDCGNTLQLICTGAYHFRYNGSDVGVCIWPKGINDFKYRKRTTPCDWVFHAVFHRTQDTIDDPLPTTKDCGIWGRYDWQDNYYEPCLLGPPAPPRCCSGEDDPGEDPGAECPFPGDCDHPEHCWRP